MSLTGQAAMRDLRRDVFGHIQKLHLGFFDRYPVGRLVTRATNDVENIAEMFSSGIVALVTDVAKMIGFAVVLFLLEPRLALVSFLVVPILAACAIAFRRGIRDAFRKVRVRIARINATLQETVTGMKVVQLFTREARNQRDFDAMNADAPRRLDRLDPLRRRALRGGRDRGRHLGRGDRRRTAPASPPPARSTSSSTGCAASSCRCAISRPSTR